MKLTKLQVCVMLWKEGKDAFQFLALAAHTTYCHIKLATGRLCWSKDAGFSLEGGV